MKENIYINKVSESKYEIVTKDINFEPGVYTLFALEKNLFVVKKQFYKQDYKTEYKQETKNYENNEIKSEENISKQDYNQTNSNDQTNTQKEEKDEQKEWYKKALEIKTKLVQDQFLALQDLEDVRKISYVTRQEINSGDILGIRSFDKNYYVFKKQLFERIKNAILDMMNKDPILLEDMIDKLQYPKDQILGAIELLKEQSDLIEVKKGLFRKV